jgi:hypothetical protein
VSAFLRRVDEFFMKKSPVHQTMRNLALRLPRAGIPYAVVGGMALGLHGYERLTEDVDLLLGREGHERFLHEMVGLGFVPAFAGARRRFRDVVTGVAIDVLVEGEYPGDGKQKPVRFPDPSGLAVEVDGVRTLPLDRLIELKLASGSSAADRLKDLADVQGLIARLSLPRRLAIDDSVVSAYERLWDGVLAAREYDGPGSERPDEGGVRAVDLARQALIEAIAGYFAGKATSVSANVQPHVADFASALGRWICDANEAAIEALSGSVAGSDADAGRIRLVEEIIQHASSDPEIARLNRAYLNTGLEP